MFPQKIKILLVDDRPENLHAMKITLSPLEEAEIITAKSGNEALSLMLEHEFAVVLMDVQMPVMDGFETAALMQNHPATQNIPIIFVTAISKDEEHVFKGYASGAVDYLFKPVNHSVLISKVKVFLNLYRQRRECEEMQKEIQKIRNLETLGVLAGGIAHDFNNLMTAVFANVELAKLHSDPDGKVYEMLADTLNAADQARDLTQELLVFSKGSRPAKEYVDIIELLTSSTSQLLKDTNLNVHMDVNTELNVLEIDRGQMSQVFQNLTQNAREAMPEGGNLYIRVDNVRTDRDHLPPLIIEGSYIKISFEDDGPGIREDMLTSIFDPYFSTKEKGAIRGQGLGLTIVHSIIQKHGGYILAESRPGQGASFHIYLPISKKLKEAHKETEGDAAPAPISETKKLLILEDQKMLAKVLVEMLKVLGYESQVAENQSEVLSFYSQAREESKPFDGVILELTTQEGETGEKVLQKLREMDPKVKAIVFSDYARDPVIVNYKEYGFDGVIRKPFTLSALADELKLIY